MAMEFTDTATESVANGVKMLVHAPAGHGKTMLVATLPSPVLISAESGLLSLSPGNIAKVFGANEPDISYNIPTIKIYSAQDLEDAYQWCISSDEAKAFETIALDSITEIMEQILVQAKLSNRHVRAAYGDLISNGVALIKGFRDIEGKNVYMSSKQAPFKDEMANTTKYGVGMPGAKLQNEVPYLFDEVYALRIGVNPEGENYRYLQTQPDLQYEAKNRSGALEAAEYPHIGAIIAKIKAHATSVEA